MNLKAKTLFGPRDARDTQIDLWSPKHCCSMPFFGQYGISESQTTDKKLNLKSGATLQDAMDPLVTRDHTAAKAGGIGWRKQSFSSGGDSVLLNIPPARQAQVVRTSLYFGRNTTLPRHGRIQDFKSSFTINLGTVLATPVSAVNF